MNNFRKKNDPHSWFISQITDIEKQIRSMSNKSRFRGRFEKQDGKRTQRLLKSVNYSTFTIFIDNCEGNSLAEILP